MNSICYLCGDKPADTRDHIFPKNLFPRPLPSNLPTVPSCGECNNSLSNDEELFRAFLASGLAFETSLGYRIWTERVRPSLQMNRRGFKTLLRRLTKEVKLLSPNGISVGNTMRMEVEQERINRVLKKIEMGLYYLDTGQPLPEEVQFVFHYAGHDWQIIKEPPFNKWIQGAKRVDLGKGVVTCLRNTVQNDPSQSFTCLVFYEVTLFLVLTYCGNILPNTESII